MNLARTIGCNKMVVNLDNLEVITTMNAVDSSSVFVSTLFDNCYFMSLDFTHVTRVAVGLYGFHVQIQTKA